MKKIAVIILLCGLTSVIKAQTVKFTAIAGMNEATYHQATPVMVTANESDRSTSSTLAGLQAGIYAGFDAGNFTIQPGMMYSQKGSNTTLSSVQQVSVITTSTSFTTEKQQLYYLEIPVNLLYNFKVKKMGRIFIGGGPYMGLGLSAKVSGTIQTTTTFTMVNLAPLQTTTVFSGTNQFGGGQGQIQNPDYGINAVAGAAIKNGFVVKVGYGFGLTDISGGGNDKKTNRVLNLSLGYTLW